MQTSFSIRVLVEAHKRKPRLKLSINLFLEGVRKLHPGIISFELFSIIFIFRWIEWQTIDDLTLVFINDIIDIMIDSG